MLDLKTGLYDSANEHDGCGVGLVADLNNVPGRRPIELALKVLKNLSHRGGVGGDARTGDGAGLSCALPDAFFQKVFSGLPKAGSYAAGIVFGGRGRERLMEEIVVAGGARLLGWRETPLDLEIIGPGARASCPAIRQLFISGENFPDQNEFERRLFAIRRRIEKSCPEVYLVSLSSRLVVYKGLLMAEQLAGFYPDLSDPDFISPLAVVHQRYSTNTFPTWELAQPFRFLAHNGEINTIRGNLSHLRAREPYFQSDLLGAGLADILPLVDRPQSDSASLDNMFELLTAAGRDQVRAMMMLMPQAFGPEARLGRDLKGFFNYHAALMEPWDGPAAVIFTDGLSAGGMSDRNGLRPLRYTLTRDGLLVLASEAGAAEIAPDQAAESGRLGPGEMIYCDLARKRLVKDQALKNMAARYRPYRRWVEENHIEVNGLFETVVPAEIPPLLEYEQRLFGYSREDLEVVIKTMAESGREPVGSMGGDCCPAAFSRRPQLMFNYFRVLFAQVTNPPIDPVRERLSMSLTTFVGAPGNILDEGPELARVLRLERPVITETELGRLTDQRRSGFKSAVLALGFWDDLGQALDRLAETAVDKARRGHRILILSDRRLSAGLTPIPSLLATAAVHQALAEDRLRSETNVIVQTGEAREVLHFSLLLAFGASLIHPYLALASVSSLAESGAVKSDPATAAANYLRAVTGGLLKSMSKMGISTLRSYRAAGLFEALGLGPKLMNRYFKGLSSPIGGHEMEKLAADARRRARAAEDESGPLPDNGLYRWRPDGEEHLWTPSLTKALRRAAGSGEKADREKFLRLAENQSRQAGTLRSRLDFSPAEVPIPLDQVESAPSIARRFVAAAMSLGAISPEAHECIARAMNELGAASNCGEGGEDPGRAGGPAASVVRQVASGRFGVDLEYLAAAGEIQIKMAQGAKPGEGGQLPGRKVTAQIAALRRSTPGQSLISPPPHHDIYSIEDLAQLIYDLRRANPQARISVKLAARGGVGTVAAGVVKAGADAIVISGHDGGTGAAPLTGLSYAGLPWELGLAEVQQTLILNHLRDRVRLQVDGGLKTGREVTAAALLGSEEYGFGTAILAAVGCLMCRRCQEGRCPAALATQDEELRAGFNGRASAIKAYLLAVAGEVREHLAALGFRTLDEAVGRVDRLRVKTDAEGVFDFSRLLFKPQGPSRFGGRCREPQDCYDQRYLLPQLAQSIATGQAAEFKGTLGNTDRAVGTALSGELVRRHGAPGLPEETLTLNLSGSAGQSLGAFLARGVHIRLAGEANDYVGKGLSGGVISLFPPAGAGLDRDRVIAGNVVGYGATAGRIFIAGRAGERFAVRNSGALMVAEGVGEHGCEYMTGGLVLVLGPTGLNFAAGLTGGRAYVLDEGGDFDQGGNPSLVDLENIVENSGDEAELLEILRAHQSHTASPLAGLILKNWPGWREKFIKVSPVVHSPLQTAVV